MDYLLKPIISSELKEAVKRVIQLKAANKSDGVNQHEVLINNLLKVDTEKKICLATFDELKIYSISDITRCESQHNYTTFYFIQDKPILISKTIKDYEELLKDFGFIRIHQSHLINIKYIKAFIKREGGFVRMIDDVEVPVSRRKKEEVLEILNKM